MERDTAEKFVDAIKRLDQILEEMGGLTHDIDDTDEKNAVRRAIAEFILDMHEKITRKYILNRFPDLDHHFF